jgi:predicted nuclease with TOPRIM domain
MSECEHQDWNDIYGYCNDCLKPVRVLHTELRTLREDNERLQSMMLDSSQKPADAIQAELAALREENEKLRDDIVTLKLELAALREAIDSIASAADAPTGNHVRLYQIRKLCRKARTEGGG